MGAMSNTYINVIDYRNYACFSPWFDGRVLPIMQRMPGNPRVVPSRYYAELGIIAFQPFAPNSSYALLKFSAAYLRVKYLLVRDRYFKFSKGA